MDGHNLSGVCAYIKDFMKWNEEMNYTQDPIVFVRDRFSQCSEDKKELLSKIFKEINIKKTNDKGYYSSINKSIIKLRDLL